MRSMPKKIRKRKKSTKRAQKKMKEKSIKKKIRSRHAASEVVENISNNTKYPFRILENEKPHSISWLVFLVTFFAVFGFRRQEVPDPVADAKAAIFAIVLAFSVYCALQVRDGILVRPHPMVWRVVHGFGVLYMLTLAGLLLQSVESSRAVLQLFFDDIGDAGNETRSKHTIPDCTISSTVIWNQVNSVWFVSHCLGWVGKMVMIRDLRMCFIQSIAFELCELSLQFLIPDFVECWWNSLLLDAFGANILGIIVGWAVLEVLGNQQYDWAGIEESPTGNSNDWKVFSSPRRFFLYIVACVIPLVIEVNLFFLMFALGVSPHNPLPKVRLGIFFSVGVAAFRELYAYTSDPTFKRIGQNSWLIFTITMLEVLCSIKLGQNITWASPPVDIWLPLSMFFSLFSLWAFLFFQPHVHNIRSNWLDCLYWASFAPLLSLFRLWAY